MSLISTPPTNSTNSSAPCSGARRGGLRPSLVSCGGSTSITHATVVDVATDKKLPDQTVALQGDRIISVSATDSASAPQGRVIEAHGNFLIPGLWDMHIHIQDLEDLPLYIANGVTGVRMMFGAKDTKELRAKLSTAPVSPEIIVGSAIVDGDPPVWPGSIIVNKPDDARRTVDSIKSSGADFVKIYNGIPCDVCSRNSTPMVLLGVDGLYVICWDRPSNIYRFFTCFNDSKSPCKVRGTAHWEVDTFVNEYEELVDGKMSKWLDSFIHITPTSQSLVAAMDAGDGTMKTLITTTSTRR